MPVPEVSRVGAVTRAKHAPRARRDRPLPGAPTDFAAKIQVLAGLLVAGFGAAVNFICLSNGEVSTVLRNQAHYPTLVFDLIVAGGGAGR